MIQEIIIILILIILNGILSASEIAIVSSRKARLQAAGEKSPGALKALQLKEHPNQFLSTIQIGITLIGILTGFFSGGSISTYIASYLDNIAALAPYSNTIAIFVVVFIITFLSLVIGELVPKRIGMAIPEKYASIVALPMDVLSKVVRPFVWMLSISTDALVKLLNIKPSKNTVTEEEIKALVDEGVDSGIIEDFEHDLVDRLLLIGDKKAINIMVHRSEITYLNLQGTVEENTAFLLQQEHTDYPVCDGNFDNIKGVVHTKTLLNSLLSKGTFDLHELTQPIPFVNENSNVYAVMEVLKHSKVMQAVVIDEYGSPQGIITMKDIISGLIGGIDNVNYQTSKLIRKREDGSFLIEGRYQLDDFFEEFAVDITDEDEEELSNVTTLGGLVFLKLDHVPIEGEHVLFKNYKLEVIDMDGNRIDKILLTRVAYSGDDTI